MDVAEKLAALTRTIHEVRKMRGHEVRRIDRRTKAARRAEELADMYRAKLGAAADDPMMAHNIAKASRLLALAEAEQAKALNSDLDADLDLLVKLNRLADAAVRRLKLDERKQPAGPSLMQYLAERQREGSSS
jgi:hypothetical protein